MGIASPAARVLAAQTSWVPGRLEPRAPPPPPGSGPHPPSPAASRPAPQDPGPGHPPARLPAPGRGRELGRKSRDTHRASFWAQGAPGAVPSGAPAGVRGVGCALGPCSHFTRSSRRYAGANEGEGGLLETKRNPAPSPATLGETGFSAIASSARCPWGCTGPPRPPQSRAPARAAPAPPGAWPLPPPPSSVASLGRGQGRPAPGWPC